MEIFFCSHCNQSIPLKDIQSGMAELRRGKYLCATCKVITPAYRERRQNFAAMYLGIFLVGTLVVIGYLIFQEDLFPAARQEKVPVFPDRKVILASLENLGEDIETESRTTRQQMTAGLSLFDERLSKQEASLTLAMSRIRFLQENPGKGITSEDFKDLKLRSESQSRELGALRKEIDRVRELVESLRTELKVAAESAAKETAKPEPKPEVSEVDLWIAQLGDLKQGKRFEAVWRLAEFKGPRVVEALIGCLKDEDFFIRRTVVEDLGERKAEAAAPALVETLGDEDQTVRDAAVKALRKITGKSFGFKSGASARERGRAVAKWRNHVAGLLKKK